MVDTSSLLLAPGLVDRLVELEQQRLHLLHLGFFVRETNLQRRQLITVLLLQLLDLRLQLHGLAEAIGARPVLSGCQSCIRQLLLELLDL